MASPSHEELTATLRERLQTPDGQVEADLIKGGEQLDEACLRRWLRADNWQLDKAEKRLRAHAKWRVTIAPNGRVDEVRLTLAIVARKPRWLGVFCRTPRPLLGICRHRCQSGQSSRLPFTILNVECRGRRMLWVM